MSPRSGRATPHPRFRFAIQLSGGDSRRLIYLVAVGEVHPGESVSPEQPPPHLDEVQPRRALRDERMLYSGRIFEPLLDQGALVSFQVVGDQVDDPFRDGALYLLEQLYVALGVPGAGSEGQRLAVLYSESTEHPCLVRASTVFQGRFYAMAVRRTPRSRRARARGYRTELIDADHRR